MLKQRDLQENIHAESPCLCCFDSMEVSQFTTSLLDLHLNPAWTELSAPWALKNSSDTT